MSATVLDDPIVEDQIEVYNSDNAERFAHWVDAQKANASKLSGKPVVALCGKVWKADRNPENYPICPKCNEIYNELVKKGIVR